MAVVLIFLLIGTGILLKFVYVPVPDQAYESILRLQNDVMFGQLMRNIHYWSGNGLVLVVFLHFLRVFFTGAFLPPRQFNWIIGLGLFFIVLMSNFTGYLMPWDQLAFWAITICTSMLEYIPVIGIWIQELVQGGSEVGASTLLNFYAIHTTILPALLFILMLSHFWRVRKAGGVVIPQPSDASTVSSNDAVPTIPNLMLREAVVALVLLAFMLVLSMLFDAPLGSKANAGLSPDLTKAPWYFAGIQELLIHIHPIVLLLIMPAMVMVALISLPYLNYQNNTTGVWFASTKGRKLALIAAATSFIATPTWILLDEYVINSGAIILGITPIISDGLLPVSILCGAIYGFYVLIKNKYDSNINETVQSIFVLLLVAFVVFTLTATWFRGPGMKLTLPW
jgi:quinol-cytochrome oxidoreductase complex cytochrome b subunit